MSNIDPTSRPKFFPNSTTSVKTNRHSPLQGSYLERNSSVRKNELESLAKRDAKVEIPDAVKDFSRIKKAVDTAPDIDNSDKIARLKSQINSGQYKVDYEALADKILSSEF